MRKHLRQGPRKESFLDTSSVVTSPETLHNNYIILNRAHRAGSRISCLLTRTPTIPASAVLDSVFGILCSGKSYCDKCWKQYKHQCAYQKRQLRNGHCRCGRETDSADDKTCAKCQNASKVTRATNHAAGLCWCGKVPVAGGRNCEKCLTSKEASRKARREKGLCDCNRQLDDPRWKTCNACRERRERNRKPKEAA